MKHRLMHGLVVGGLLLVTLLLTLGVASPAYAAMPDRVYSGTGTQVIGPFHLDAGLFVGEWTYSGTGNFIVTLQDSSAAWIDLVANTIGTDSGASAENVESGDYYLEIEGTGTWSITVRQPVVTGTPTNSSFSGTGARVTEFFYLTPGAHTFNWSNAGSSNFIVWLLDADGNWVDLVANEIGSVSGSSLVSADGGYYLLEIESDGAWSVNTPYIAALPTPVYRFYNTRTGTHFYTADPAEMQRVRDTMGAIYTYEGVGYTINTSNPANSAPLYRFYNKKTGTHLYTADEGEKNTILSTLSAIYSLDGVAYNVSMTSGTQVHRFFSPSKGVHFYSSDPTEIANVRANLAHIWQYEGPAYYVGQ